MAKKLRLEDLDLVLELWENIRRTNRIAKLFTKKTGRSVGTYEVARILRNPDAYRNPHSEFSQRRQSYDLGYA